MKVRYKSGSLYIIEIINEKVYYGNGENLNSFGCHAVQFLRFNPYMEYVGDKNILVPEKIKQYIEQHMDELEKVPAIRQDI
jgi:hypothetical protein